MRKITAFDFLGKHKKHNYKEMKEHILSIYKEKAIKSGKVFLVDKGCGLGLSFHNNKNLEIDYISNVVALKDMKSAKRWFDILN